MRTCNCCNNNGYLIDTISLSIVNDIKLNNIINIYCCNSCNFYYSDSDNTQQDYNNYYKRFNNYKEGVVYSNKDEKCSIYLRAWLKNKNVKNILDYGSGNGKIKELLSDNYSVDNFDIGMDENTKKYDCLLLSHVLEHIYDINEFVQKVSLK
jgi:2-polyprenyl-3-methyl-5-hydroxy-6-metoxy-1,4-benzoquinol methylase